MIDESRKRNNVKELIKSKRYFDAGFNWYFNKYLGFFWQKRLFLYLFFIIASVGGFASYLNYATLSEKPIIAKIVANIDSSDEMSIIRSLKTKNIKDPNLLIAYYLIEKYVTIRESYSYSNLDYQKNFLFNNSTSFIYIDYKKSIDLTNSSSPIILFGTRNIINIEIDNILVKLDDNRFPNKAEVTFHLIDVARKKIIGYYQAELEFFMNNVYFVTPDATRFTFTMLRYKTYQTK